MTRFLASRPLFAVLLAAIAIAGWICLLSPASWFVAPVVQTIEPAKIVPNAGRSYVAPVPLKPDYGTFLQIESDHIFGPRTSNLQVREDGKPLGPPHSYHSDIWDKGAGRYSHWGNAAGSAVVFSTGDSSDPRTNGRRYEIIVQPEFSGFLVSLILFTAFASTALLAAIVSLPWRIGTAALAVSALGCWVALYFGHVSFSEDTSNYTDWLRTVPLGYPLFLSAINHATGSLRWTSAVQVGLMTSASIFIALQLGKLSGRTATAFAALAALLIYTPMFAIEHDILSEGLFVPLILINIGAAFCLIRRLQAGYAILLALSAALIMFVRPAGYFAVAGVLFLILAGPARAWLLRWALIPTIVFIACTALTNVAVRGTGTPSQVGRVLSPHVAFLFKPEFATDNNKEYGQVAFDAIAKNRDGYMSLTSRADRFNYILNDYNRRLLASDAAIYRLFVARERPNPGEDDQIYRFRRMNEIYLSLFLSTVTHEPLRYLRLVTEQVIGAWQYSILYDYGRVRQTYLSEADNQYESRVKYVKDKKLSLSDEDVRFNTALMNGLPGDFVEALDTGYRNVRTQRWLIYLIGAITLIAIPLGGLVFRNSWRWVALGYCGVMIHGSMLLTAAVTVFIPRYAIPVDPVILLAGVIAMDGVMRRGVFRLLRTPADPMELPYSPNHSHEPHLKVQSDYRADIDGLRAVAVVAVLLFHLGFTRFGGGFIGVDVFFVISGYLITGMIRADVERGSFRMMRFLARRGRRLLPAMFIVIAISCVAAFLMLSPDHLRSFAASAVAAVFGISNLLFWQESDYFDLSARLKPLLHTWTLGVEWQFYLVWPVFIAFAMSSRARWTTPQMVMALALISLVAASVTGWWWPAATFYLMPFRVFEFAAGAMLLWQSPLRGGIAEPALVVGLALIAAAALLLDDKTLHNPAMMLLPSIGASLAILSGTSSAIGVILRNPVSAYLGRASYSIYLVHWPIIVFTEYFLFRQLTTEEALKIFVISIAAGSILHHAIEKPIHKRQAFNLPGYAGVTILAFAAIGISLPALLAVPDGLSWRIDANSLGLRYENTKTLVSKEILGHLGCTEPCVFGKDDGPLVLVFGDSHVDHFTKTLLNMGGTRYRFHYAGSVSCFNGATLTMRTPQPAIVASCRKARETLLGWVKSYKYKAIIVGQRWFSYGRALSRGDEPVDIPDQATLEKTMLSDVTALFPEFSGPFIIAGWAPITNTACYTRPRYLGMTCPTISFVEYETFRKAVSEFKATTPLDMHFVDVAKAICPDGRCELTDRRGRILYTDSDHLSIYGAELIVLQFLDIITAAK